MGHASPCCGLLLPLADTQKPYQATSKWSKIWESIEPSSRLVALRSMAFLGKPT